MKDFLGNEIKVGSVVAYIHRNGKYSGFLKKATVQGFTPAMVRLDSGKLRHPADTILLPTEAGA